MLHVNDTTGICCLDLQESLLFKSPSEAVLSAGQQALMEQIG